MSAPFAEICVLARGEIADVLLADMAGDVVIVKRLRHDLCADEEIASTFRRELAIVRRLSHPNVVRLLATGTDRDGAPFFAMERLEGLTLRDLLNDLERRGGRLHPGEASAIAARIARALSYVHALTDESGKLTPVIHRDVSPDNVMLTDDGAVKVLDFGIARVASIALTRSGFVRGKLAYMAPEQIGGLELGPRADVFSLGIVLWEMLVGRHPFAAKTVLEVARGIREAPAPAPSMHASVPRELDGLVLAMLAKFALGRPESAAVVAPLERMASAAGIRDIEHHVAALVRRSREQN